MAFTGHFRSRISPVNLRWSPLLAESETKLLSYRIAKSNRQQSGIEIEVSCIVMFTSI